MDEPPGSNGTVVLVLNTEVIGSSRSGETGELPDKERMQTLRVVILHPDGTVEHNQFLDFGGSMQAAHTLLVKVRQNETKTIYLIANENSVDGLEDKELDGFVKGAAGFKEKADNLFFTPDYTNHPLPMTSVYRVEIEEKSKECQFYLVRAATKFTFRFKNMRSGPVTVNNIAVSDIAGSMYLMPRKQNLQMKFKEEDGSESELFWIDWLQKVSDESQANPDDKKLADRRGWITDYDIPAGTVSNTVAVSAPDNFQVAGLAYEMGVPKPGTAVYPAFYLPESKHLKSPDGEIYGEQAYTMTFDLTDDKKENKVFRCPFDNLKALFRNTHVVVDVTFAEKGISVDVIPYSEVVLKPVFGLSIHKQA